MDILVCGLPKTGTSALIYLLADSFEGSQVVFEPNDFRKYEKNSRKYLRRARGSVPTRLVRGLTRLGRRLTSKEGVEQPILPGTGKRLAKILYDTKDPRSLEELFQEFAVFEKKIWIARDPRDQVVSTFLYAWYHLHGRSQDAFDRALELVLQKEQGEHVSLISIMRDTLEPQYFHDPEYYGERVVAYFRQPRAGLFLFPYEDLINHRYHLLEEFLQTTIEGEARVPDKLKRVVRTKGSGGWRAWFEREDVDYFRPILQEYMGYMGITDDWELSDAPIDPALSSQYMRKQFYRERHSG